MDLLPQRNEDDGEIVAANLLNTRINDDQLAVLRKLPNLEVVLLDSAEVTDAGLGHLHRLRHMKYLLLRGTSATDAGVELLKQKLPNCVVYR